MYTGEIGVKQTYFRTKIEEYMNRAEEIKRKVQKLKDDGKYHEQINITNNSTGHGYETVFGRFLDGEVVEVEVQDPYIRSHHQCQNFLRLCELFVKKCEELNRIRLVTGRDGQNGGMEQERWLNTIKGDLLRYNVQLVVEFSPTLHDRQIVLNTGWIIKIGRGLDYFKAPDNKFCVGAFDLDLRQCHETVIDIFHTNSVKRS